MEKISKNQQGVALLLVMGVIALLSFILFEFTFETKLNRLKVFNQEDRFQARLNAEAGLNFAMAKLRLYQEGRNILEKDETKKNAFPPGELEALLIQPFIYPIPLSAKASIIQQNALKDFEKNSLLRGEMSVTITKISGLLNPNSLRIIDKKTTTKDPNDDMAKDDDPNNQDPNANPDPNKDKTADDGNQEKSDTPKENKWETAKNLFVKTLTQLMEDKLQKDEEFHNKHANTRVETLVNELAFYVNDVAKVQGQDYLDAKAKFSDSNLTPKHAPMASIEELYLLPSWDDSIVDLVKERMSVHEQTTISVNEMTNADLKILFPEINNIQIEEFFKYRDGDPDKKIPPTKFKSAEDFKNAVVGKLNITNEADYNKRINELKNAGLTIDTAGKLYRINAMGKFNNASYNLVAIVDLPVKEKPVTKDQKTGQGQNPNGQNPNGGISDPNQGQGQNDQGNNNDPNKKKPEPAEFLMPRVVEIRAE